MKNNLTFRIVQMIVVAGMICTCGSGAQAADLCKIVVTDESNGWPVSLVELRTIHNERFVTDNAGVIAFDLLELMGVETWFYVEGHGYGVKPDMFGYEGVRLTPTPGETLTVKIKRELPAKRLGRITGAGIFGESQKLGEHADWSEQGILGCDSVQNAVHNGKLYWAWGDTNLPGYPLGLFHMLSGTTAFRPLEKWEPPIKIRYDYFRDEAGRPREVARMPGDGPTWIGGYTSLPDAEGRQRLVGHYVKIEPPLTTYETGLCVWNEDTEKFDRFKVLWERSEESTKAPPAPGGHPNLWTDADGKDWILFGNCFPSLKCPPTFEAWSDPDTWETLEPQKTVPVASGSLSKSDAHTTGSGEVIAHNGCIVYNEYREQWVAIFTQIYGEESVLGEIWYAEADSPLGPWGGAIRVVTHDKYSFYNPRIHPEFTPAGSPILIFEGTYTKAFSGNENATPRYDYNQVLYRIDLDDPIFNKK